MPRSSPTIRQRLQTQLPLFGRKPPAAEPDDLLAREWRRQAPHWSRLWRTPDLSEVVRVELSRRMRSSLGSYFPDLRLIRLSDVLLEAPRRVLREVLCHEAAHAAVELLHGPDARTHGEEWQALMKAAGLRPRVRIDSEDLGTAAQRAARRRYVWAHHCSRCRQRRWAGRPVRQWRCARCLEQGYDGMLVITRHVAPRG